jgi:putative endonuclease
VPIKSNPEHWTDSRHVRGLEGEQVAMRYLTFAGWTILHHRFRMGRFEIDVVARKGSLVAFIEVKTRWGSGFGRPVEAVTWAKRRDLARVAQAWVDRHGRAAFSYRFDVIGVTLSSPGPHRVEHVEDAFRVGWR